jgi:flagellar hook-associated protein 3 FlgL
MKTTFVSTAIAADLSRRHIDGAQRALLSAQTELATGRHDDVALTLGHDLRRSVSLRSEVDIRTAISTQNDLSLTRLSATQDALSSLVSDAEEFVSTLLAARSSQGGPALAAARARLGLEALANTVNATHAGTYLFAGIASDSAPLIDYNEASGSAARASITNAFQASFGILPNDPAAANLTPAQIRGFLDGQLAAVFDDPSWQSNWSVAASEPIVSRISLAGEAITSVTANDQAIRDVARALAMVAEFSASALSEDAHAALFDRAVEVSTDAIAGLRSRQGSLGQAQNAMTEATSRMRLEIDVMSSALDDLEGVDPHEAATRVNALLTDLETSYAVAARLRSLSILNYL